MSRRGSALALVVVAALAGCGGSQAFKLTADDNSPDKLEAAFARMGAPRSGPMNAKGRPTAYLVAGPRASAIIAFDLAGKKELWRVAAPVSSKVVVGADFIARDVRNVAAWFTARGLTVDADGLLERLLYEAGLR